MILDPYDLVAVPPRVVRRFENVSDKTARLLVIVNGDSAEDFNDIEQPQIVADELTGQFGRDAVEKLLAMGFSFNAGVDDPVI